MGFDPELGEVREVTGTVHLHGRPDDRVTGTCTSEAPQCPGPYRRARFCASQRLEAERCGTDYRGASGRMDVDGSGWGLLLKPQVRAPRGRDQVSGRRHRPGVFGDRTACTGRLTEDRRGDRYATHPDPGRRHGPARQGSARSAQRCSLRSGQRTTLARAGGCRRDLGSRRGR